VELTAAELARDAAGTLVAGSPDVSASSYTIDSRLLTRGGCFVALVAARDGHDFVPDAWTHGASVVIVSRPVAPPPGPGAVITVDDGLAALARLGRAARQRLTDVPVVAITGSAGKTATKDLTAAALASRHRVQASPASYNNEAGVPLTLLGTAPGDDVVVTEMGARFAGNIAALADIARPNLGIVTHVGLAHAGHLGGPDGVAAVKGELVAALPADGVAILNADCPYAATLAASSAAPVVRAGYAPEAEVRIDEVTVDEQLRPAFRLSTADDSARVRLALRGEHHAVNAAMAAAAARQLGVPLAEAAEGMGRVQPTSLRMEVGRTPGGVLLINDAYNSSPTSAAAAVQALARAAVPGRRIAVLGEMLELGAYRDDAHAALGELAATVGIDLVVTVGEGAAATATAARGRGVAVIEAPDPCAAAAVLNTEARDGDAVLVKASRAVGLELVATRLLEEPGQP
jgi:UDP-N-acetylmuramoyl-tripeptide--D-alanyl-D-alanine ligase